MELPFQDSFHYILPSNTATFGKWDSGSNISGLSGGPFPTGSGKMATVGGHTTKTFTQTYNPMTIGFLTMSRSPGLEFFDFLNPGTGLGASVQVDGEGRFYGAGGYNAASTFQLANAVMTCALSQYRYIEYQFSVSGVPLGGGNFAALFAWLLKINGILVGSGSFQNGSGPTNPNVGFNQIRITSTVSDGGGIGDVIVTGTPTGGGVGPAAGLLGQIYSTPHFDLTDGPHLAWTPLVGGAHSAMLRDQPVPDGNTTYVSTTTVGAIDDATMDSVSGSVLVAALQSCECVFDDGAAGSGNIQSTYYDGTTVKLSDGPNAAFTPSVGGYLYHTDAQQTNPFTSAAWSPATVNALKFGTKKVT